MRYLLLSTFTLTSGLFLTSPSFAQENNTTSTLYNVIQLQAEASRKVSNDEMLATLYIEKSNKQPTILATEINQLMNQALIKAKKYPQVKVTTGAQSTYPIYDNNNRNLKEWRGRTELRLEGQDFKAVSQLMSELQNNFLTQSVSFNVSEAQKRQIESELMIEASKNFQQRAKSLAQAWNKSNYQLINLNFNTNSYNSPIMPRLAMMKSVAESDIPQQDIAGGESQISINANGSIQLK